jgi:spore maturation protein CgeB
MKKLRIGILLIEAHSFDPKKPGNIWGDELIARSWQKYLARRDDIETVFLYDRNSIVDENLDVVIHFYPLTPHPRAKNILYLQNAFDKGKNPGGTAGVFHRVKGDYDGYIFTSQKLMEACAPGAVVPFATDPEFFYPQPSGLYEHPVCFVGNGIRGPAVEQRYYAPALPFGLVIYGNQWSPPFTQICRGKLPMPELPKLYSDVAINLNAHIVEHAEYDTINLRIYDILACEGFILSDYVNSVVETFGDTVVTTDGYEDEWAKIVRFLADPSERRRRAQEGRKLVLSNHTYAQRMNIVVNYIREIL